jgi:hypothetical protein
MVGPNGTVVATLIGDKNYFGAEFEVCVPKTWSTSCDQAVFVDQATDMSPFSDAVLVEVDRFG